MVQGSYEPKKSDQSAPGIHNRFMKHSEKECGFSPNQNFLFILVCWTYVCIYIYIIIYILACTEVYIYIRVYVYFSELDGASCMFDYIFAWRLAGGCWKFTVRAFHLKGNQHITPKRPSIFPAELPSPDILTLTNSGPSKFEDRYQTKWWFGNVSPFRYGQILGINVRLQGGIYISTVISSDLSTYILGDVEVTLLGEVVVARWCQWTFQA